MAIDRADDKPSWYRFVLDEVVDYAKGEAVSDLTDGWIDIDDFTNDDDEEDDRRPPPEKRESFNERLERELAKLAEQSSETPSPAFDAQSCDDMSLPAPEEIPNITQAPIGPVAGTASQSTFRARPQVFGRKIA